MNAKEYINTEEYNNERYRLRKEFDDSLTVTNIYSPYKEWSNCTEVEMNIRLTPKRLYINRFFFSDTSGQQKSHLNKIYVNRNKDIDNIFNKCLSLKDTDDLNDGIELHAELKDIFNFFNEIYQNNGA